MADGFDILIKGGLVVDGSGAPGFAADVGVKDGRIAAVAPGLAGEARQVIDAKGRVVAPGFIDPHTHFDVQLLWDGAARPAIEHGVTSIIPGNCSLSLAPLKAKDRKALVGMFQQIEEMPPEAFTQAFEWTWEDFAGYRKALEAKLAINVAPLVGHSVIRLWVMGEAANQRAARPEEIAGMQALLRECLDAGAVGLSTSFVDVDEHARPVPSRFADFAELDALCAVLGEYGRMLQIVPEFYATDITIARVDQLAELSIKHKIPTTFSPLFDSKFTPDNVPRVLERVAEQFARGAQVWPQMQTRPIAFAQTVQSQPAEPDLARRPRLQTERRAQQGGLARAIGAHEADDLAGAETQADALDNRAASAEDGQVGHLQQGGHARQLRAARQATSANRGAPKRAVTTPSRSSSSLGMSRASRSASMSRIAPASADGASVRAGSSETEPRTR